MTAPRMATARPFLANGDFGLASAGCAGAGVSVGGTGNSAETGALGRMSEGVATVGSGDAASGSAGESLARAGGGGCAERSVVVEGVTAAWAGESVPLG